MSATHETEVGEIPVDWNCLHIGDVADVTKLAGYEYTKHFTYVEDGEVIALRALNVREGKLDLSDVKNIAQSVSDALPRSKLYKNDILFTYVGANIGQFALIPDSDKFHLAPNICRIRCGEKSEPYYIFSYFRTNFFRDSLEGFSHGSSQPTLPMKNVRQIPVPIPPLPEQKAIAAVLSSLDDKIDLLHRQNQTLEAMAATLFRQWFVEEAQEDWVEVKLGDFFPVVTGKKDANFSTDDGEYPFFTCSQAALKAPGFSFEGAAILLTGNGDFNVKRFIGKFEAYQRTYVLIPYDVKYLSFLYTLMKFYLSEITGGHQGSVINFITKGMITEFKFILPKKHIIIDEKLVQFKELYEKIDSNNSQIKTLETLRDTLLPKLMSGEVRVAA